MPHAIALLSGGLDSTLAILLMRKQGVEVTAVTFLTHFGCDMGDTSSCSADSTHNAVRYGFKVKLSHLSDKFIDIVKNPKFGHGRNMNPCIDCRILMLKEAKALMEITRADFIVTGEVLGQRPMSQRRETFPLIDREAGVEGCVLRPLSAKLMKPTFPETKGLIDREKLCSFGGRSRRPQMALAEEFGLTEYPAPAGGCLLTDPIFSYRLKDLLSFNPSPALKDLQLLKLGRHFRLPGGAKAVVGRDEAENNKIEALCGNGDYILKVNDFGSPSTLLCGKIVKDDILVAASLCVRHSDAKHLKTVDVTVSGGGEAFILGVSPAGDELLNSMRIHPELKSKRKRTKAL